MYEIIDAEYIKKKFGRISPQDLNNLWQAPAYQDMQVELIALMKRFELCYELEGKGEYLIPQLLQVVKPEPYLWQDHSHQLQLRFRYDFMPKGMLSRIMVRLHRHIPNPKQAWRSGVYMERKQAQAELQETWGKREITVKVQGQNCREFMTVISEAFDSLHETFEGIEVRKLIPCNCKVCKSLPQPNFYGYDELMRRKEKGKMTIECSISYEDVQVLGLIDDIFVTHIPQDSSHTLFISYSQADIDHLEAFKTHMVPLKGIISWDDQSLLPGEEWDDSIKTELAKADIIVLLVSANFLATDYIVDIEVEKAMKRHERRDAVVIPVILRPCRWKRAPFAKLNVLPRKGKPISKWKDKDEAWDEVVASIEKARLSLSSAPNKR